MSTANLHRGILGLAAATLMTPVLAQEGISFIEEIVVTSTKMSSTLQEVPVAVSVVSAADIKEAQVLDIKDLQFMVPSLRVGQLQSSGNTNFFIRGFGNGANNAGIEPSVGVFIDGVYRSRSAAALNDLPNLERVEVLRGPQSTLFGKNASAGVISVITAKPSLDETTGSVSVTAGDYSQIIVKGDVSGPLSDTVGFGLSASYNQRDGYYDNLAGGDAIGELNRYNLRGELLFLPSDSLEVRVIADYSDLDEACCGVANLVDGPTGGAIRALGGNIVSNDPFAYQGYYNYTPINQFESSGASVQFDYDINDQLTLTSITALRNLKRFDDVDSDFTSADLIDIGNQVDLDIDTFTQELRLAGSTESMSWMIGGYFFDESIDQRSEVTYGTDFRGYGDILTGGAITSLENALGLPAGTLEGAGQGLLEVSTMDDQAFSIFAQVDIDLGDRATLTLGANYTEDEKDVTFDSTSTDVFSALDMVQIGFGGAFAQITGLPPTPANIAANPGAAAAAQQISVTPCTNPPSGPCNSALALQPLQFLRPNIDFPNSVETGMTKDDATTWTVRLAFDATDDVNLYVSAGTGFKASSWNLSRDSRPFASDLAALGTAGLLVPNIFAGTRYASPEDSTVYEIGLKGQWDTVALNLAIFDQEIDGFQSNIFTGVGFSLANAGTQSTTGVEMDLRWAPTESFEATFAATWLDPLYDSFVGAQGENGPTDLSGTKPPGISELSIVTAGTYRFMLGNASAFIRGEYIYEDEVQVIENVPASAATREVSTFNASFGLAWDNGFEAMLWGRNINNDEYLVQAFPSVAQGGSYSGYPNQPATYGVTLRKYFD
ncbi:MAG: TonB-dependent receptor [Gammaproteobacteria bacterium]|nr:TonB-dependent receptor [Gammaproteobacteria bacterium]MDH5262484.1 TonB-dependent receptor [Gammaproteobacteria bacterium]MDH5584047.1 TonB-dependent receptor [Gammaproteobacteria bacterium]